jgi:hypothetical protein
MHETIIEKLLKYIKENNPDLLFQLEEEGKLSSYLADKISTVDSLLNHPEKEQPAYIVEEACMDILTQDLRPSKYNYISTVLEEEFTSTFYQLQKDGTLQFEVINLITFCQPAFDAMGFNEANEDDSLLRAAITGTIDSYLKK